MPPISELIKRPTNPDGTPKQWRTEAPLSSLQNAPADQPVTGFNPVLRCPMPAIGTVSPDSLRQFYRTGTSQFRVFTK